MCQGGRTTAPAVSSNNARLISAVPMAFEENDGQLAPGFSFLGRAQSYSVAIAPDGLRFIMPGSAVNLRFAGSHGGSPVSLSGVAYRSNYFIGSDPSKWHEGIANFSRVGLCKVYRGIDTEFYEKNGELEHDFIVSPGADAGLIRLDLQSDQHVMLTTEGDAVIPASGGEIRLRKPVAYQFDAEGRRVAVDASYRLTGKSLRFDLGRYDRRRTLVIDPVILFATYVSGSAGSTPAQIASDGNGTLFLAGSTTSITGFPATTDPVVDNSGSVTNVFVAALKSSQLGSAIQWISFLGNAGTSTATSVAYANTSTMFVGGTTDASGFPGVAANGSFGGAFPTGAGSTSGFVTSLNPATGALGTSTYIASTGASSTVTDLTTVTGLAADSTGDVFISGYGQGISLPVTANSLGGTDVLPTTAGPNNAFVIELTSALASTSPPLVTYLQSKTTNVNYQANAIQVDGGGNIYVAGTAGGAESITFPTSQSFSAANGKYNGTKDFTPCTRATTNTSVFLAQIQPGAHVKLGFSMFSCADTTSGSDTAQALAVGANGVYLVGDTVSPDLAAGIRFSNTTTTDTVASPVSGLQAAFGNGTKDGYVVHAPIASGAVDGPDAFTFIGGGSPSAAVTTVYAVGLDATNKLVQFAGETTATRTSMPGNSATGLPSGQDKSANRDRGFLYTFVDGASPLAAADLKSISYLGGSATTASQTVGLAIDEAGVGAYVLVKDTTTANGFSFSSADAVGAAVAGQTNAYLADIQGTVPGATAPHLAFTKTSDSPQVDGTPCSQLLACLITYNSAGDHSTILYKWNFNAPSASASNVVLNFGPQAALASAGSPAYTVELDGTGIECASAPNNNGTTCTVPSPLTGSHTLTLQGEASANAPSLIGTPQATFNFDGTAADAEGEQVDGQQDSVTVANPVSTTTTLTQTPVPPTIIDAAASASDLGSAGHTTVVTYTATVKNTSANESKYTTLKITLAPAFRVTTLPTVSGVAGPTCDLTATAAGCSSADIPAGQTLTYTFAGVYLGSALTGNAADGTFTETVTADGSALPQSANSKSSANVQTTVRGYAALSLSVTSDKGTYNLSTTQVPDTVTYKITLTNSGPNASGPITAAALTNTLPAYFTVTGTPNPPDPSCNTNGTGCTKLPSIPANGSLTYTVTGTFPDNGTNTDAVPQTAPNAQAADTAQFTPPTTTYDPNAATPQTLNVTVQRKADLTMSGAVTVTNPSTPCDKVAGTSACVYMANTGGVNGVVGTGINDTAQYTVTVQNAGPNLATTASVAIPLPTGFQVPITATPATGLTCPQATTMGQTLTCTGYVPVGQSTIVFTSKFADNTVPAPPPPPGQKLITTNPPANSVTISAAVVGTNNPSQLPNVTIERASHLVTLKYVCAAAGITNPAVPCPAVSGPVNLDEKVANDAPGKHDLVQMQMQIGNSQLNDAYGVTFVDPLPSYFILTQMPDPGAATCRLTANLPNDQYGHPMTGDNSVNPVSLACTLNNPIMAGTATPGTSAGSHGVMVPNSAYAQLTYYGKFQDNGLNPGIILPGNSTRALVFSMAQAASTLAVLADTVNDATSPAPAPLTVQRAAHLRVIALPSAFTQTNDSALPPAGVAGPGIAEAQPSINGGSPVTNSMRYKVAVVNDGPNIATHPLLAITLPPNANGSMTFTVQGQSIEPALQGFPGSPSCTTGNVCLDAGAINPAAQVAFNLDGFFGLNTLTEGNQAPRNFNSILTDPTIVDSNPGGTTNGDGVVPQAPITVVNTPVGSNYVLLPFAGNLAQPMNLQLGTVQAAGVTGLSVSGSSAPPTMPSGPSPYPPDNGATKQLYQFGQGGVYYALGSTAIMPTAQSNGTMVCLNSIPETFQKPERILMWALSNAPTGTGFGVVPHYTGNGSAGDITKWVLPQGGGSYSVPAPSTSYPPPGPQPQPAQVCGVLNGLADAANPTTIAVLEPVNITPYVRTPVTAANSSNSQPGKGVTAAAAQVDLTISPQNNYDYNDADPCYTGDGGTTRSTCNDNVQLTTFLFGGGNLIGEAQQVHTYFYGDIQNAPKPQFNLPAGQPQLYLVLTDQLGAQGYKQVGANNQVCDPGNPSGTYTPSTPACPLLNPLAANTTPPPAQTILPLPDDTSVTVALLTGNVGFGGSTGLIPLPQTATPEATAHITAGQTAGFSWNWLTERPEVQGAGGGTPPTLTLACVSADGTDLAAKGIQCNIPQNYVYSSGAGSNLVITAPPAIYVVTSSNTAVGALHEGPFARDMRIVAAIVFPVGAIPLVLLFRRRKALKLAGWLGVLFFASIVGMSIGCGSDGFKNQGGTTTTATPSGTYQFMVTATGTDANGNPINIKSYPFAVTVSAVQ